MLRYLLISLASLFIYGTLPVQQAEEIVNKAIEAHGGSLYEKVFIEFDFRNKHYTSDRNLGVFRYERTFKEGNDSIRDVLNNKGFKRFINKSSVELSEAKSTAYSGSVNSVIYFALLPYGLNDAAVIKEHIGNININGTDYHKIKVSFQKNGGGKDYEDEFVYWINKKEFTVDYLAYIYHTDGGGMRFRSAYNQQKVNGIVFQDYINYSYEKGMVKVEKLDSLYATDNLKELSKIELKNIVVRLK